MMVQSTFHKAFLLAFIFIALFAAGAHAQSNELGVTIGGYFPINDPLSASAAFAVGGSFAHRIASLPLASAYVEVPAFWTFNSTASAFQLITGKPRYNALFVTPGVKLKLAPEFFLSPYVLVGGGVAHFTARNVTNNSSNSATFEVGGGLDMKVAPFISARADIRDFYSGSPDLVLNLTQRQNQLITSVGLVFRF